MRILTCIRVLLAVTVALIGVTPSHATGVAGQGTWESTLLARDVGNTGTTNAFYDAALGVTWLANANVNGLMDWTSANTWANTLSVNGVGGWRLPTMSAPSAACDASNIGTNCGYNVATSSSELASLFYNALGNRAYYDTNGAMQAGPGLTNTGGFQNLQSYVYWFSTAYALGNDSAWSFGANYGGQGPNLKTNPFYAMAVHPGDVGTVVASVPEPETYAMLLAGLGVIGAVARRRQSDKALIAQS